MLAPRHLLCLFVLVLGLACAHADPQPPAVAVAPAPGDSETSAPPPTPGPEADARAEAAFRALEPKFEAVLAITTDDPKRLKAALTSRLKGVSELERGYQEITRLGSNQWTVAALVRLGETYDELAHTFREIPAPAGLTADQLEIFRSELGARALPLEEKASAAYQRAISVEGPAVEPSDWVLFARERLSKRVKPSL